MTTINQKAKAGQAASAIILFGKHSRYGVWGIHTRFNAITWFVSDAEQVDDLGYAIIIRQEPTLAQAIAGLESEADYQTND